MIYRVQKQGFRGNRRRTLGDGIADYTVDQITQAIQWVEQQYSAGQQAYQSDLAWFYANGSSLSADDKATALQRLDTITTNLNRLGQVVAQLRALPQYSLSGVTGLGNPALAAFEFFTSPPGATLAVLGVLGVAAVLAMIAAIVLSHGWFLGQASAANTQDVVTSGMDAIGRRCAANACSADERQRYNEWLANNGQPRADIPWAPIMIIGGLGITGLILATR